MPTHDNRFIVALTADFFDTGGRPKYRDLGLSVLDSHSHIERRTFSEHRPTIDTAQIGDANGVIVLTPKVTAQSVSQAENLLAIGRFGVGYDAVDVAACTAANVAVFITAGAVDRSVAEATVCWMLAITHQVRIKDRLVRAGQWDHRSNYMGGELRDRVFGAIGLGGIARATIGLLKGFAMKEFLAYDPLVDRTAAAKVGAARGPPGTSWPSRLCFAALPSERHHPRASRRQGAGDDEAQCIPHQYRPGRHRGRGRPLRGAQGWRDRRRGN